MDWGGGQGRGTKRCNIRKKEMGNETKKNAITEQKHAFPMTLALFSKPVNVHLTICQNSFHVLDDIANLANLESQVLWQFHIQGPRRAPGLAISR